MKFANASDRRAYEMCRLALAKYREAPETIRAHALTQIEGWRRGEVCSPWYWQRWSELLALPVEGCERVVMADTDEGQALRANNPFPGIFAREERARILAAGHEAAGV